jgi:hypothetical protein
MTKEELCDALRNTHPSRMMCKKAADEIERLAEELQYQYACDKAQQQEIERLSAENNWLQTALRAAQIALAQSDAEPVAGLVEVGDISEQVWQALCARADASAGLIETAEINYILTTLKHARVFITSREKMHPTGVELYDELIEKLRARAADRSGK